MTLTVDRIFAPCGISGERFASELYPSLPLEAHGDPQRLADLANLPLWDDPEALIRGSTAELAPTVYGRSGSSAIQRHAPPAEAALAFRRGESVALEGAEDLHPAIAKWSRVLERELGLPPGGCRALIVVSGRGPAVPLHVDGIEVLVVHLRGAKIWRYAENQRVRFVDRGYFPSEHGPGVRDESRPLYDLSTLADDRPPLKETTLRPGSALFLPRGWWHATECVEPSVSITFRLRNATAYSVLADAIARRLATHAIWRQPIAGARGQGAWRDRAAATLDALLPLLARDLALLPGEGGALLAGLRDPLLRPSPSHRIEVRRATREVVVLENEAPKRRLRVPEELLDLASRIGDHETAFDERELFERMDVPAEGPAGALVHWLKTAGALLADAPDAPKEPAA